MGNVKDEDEHEDAERDKDKDEAVNEMEVNFIWARTRRMTIPYYPEDEDEHADDVGPEDENED